MNYIDVIIIGFLLYSAYQGYRRGFLVGVLSLAATAISIYLALFLYPSITPFLTARLAVNEKVAPFFVFLGLIILLETLGSFVLAIIDAHIISWIYKFKPFITVDRILGIFPSVLLTALFATLLMLLPVTVPMSAILRQDVTNSWWGKNMLPKAYTYLPKLERLAHQLPTKSLLYLIPRSPSSEESVSLQIPKSIALQIDAASEARMLELVNRERTSRGLKPLTLRQDLVPVARAHSTDMFERSYFSHINPDGKSPFDRMEAAGIKYTAAGENLAYAPDVEIAHQGLMNSPGHRENILRPEFGRIGIGVIDGGIYGKMFTQNFTD